MLLRGKLTSGVPPLPVGWVNYIVPCPAAEYEKAESAANAVEERVKAVHAKIMEVSGGKVKAAQKKLDDATKKLEKVRW